MKYIKNLFLIGLGVAVVAVGCKKDEESTPTPTKTDLLCGKTYKMTGMIVNPGIDTGSGSAVTDIWPLIEACSKDDEFTFKTSGKVTTDEGASKCVATDPQSYDEDWKFVSNESVIEITEKDSKKKNYTIITLNGTDLKLSYTETDSSVTPPVSRTYTVTSKKK